ncbi:MAG TPA: DUF2690 domain-containing protein [Streptosporangiaceae bacterium]|nr:DUF2690 domain-containing protein [Streptosporangiaceae bacterium]
MPKHRIGAVFTAFAAVAACALWAPAAAQAATTSHMSLAHHPLASSAAAPGHRSPPRDNWWQCSPGLGGYQCDHTDPYQTGCASSGVFKASGNAWLGSEHWQVQLYYSTACGTVWSRLQLLSGANNCWACLLQVQRYYYGSNDAHSEVGSADGSLYSGAWTDQLYLPCGGSMTGASDLWHYWYGPLGNSNSWNPGC